MGDVVAAWRPLPHCARRSRLALSLPSSQFPVAIWRDRSQDVLSTSLSDFFANQVTAVKWTGRALRSRNYRLFFAGQGISLVGTWMQRVAMSWLVYTLTGSPLMLGGVDFAGQMTAFAVGPLGGMVADRFDRRRIMFATQGLAMLQACVLAYLVLTGTVQVWHLFALGMLLGLSNGFDMPARQAYVVEMIRDKQDLPNAIALNSTIFNGARLVGPSIAGVVIAATNEGTCFVLNAVSYLAVIAALIAMRVPPRQREANPPTLVAGLRQGFAYAWRTRPIRNTVLLIALANLAGTPYSSLMPVFAKDILHGGPQTFGWLMSCAGVGAIVGALYLASRANVKGLPLLTTTASFCFALGVMAFSQSTSLPLSMALMLLTGFGMMAQMASANTLLQTSVDDDKRGRIMAIHMMSFTGTAPFGSLWGGAAATHIGAPLTVLIGGGVCLLGAVGYASQLRAVQATGPAAPAGGTTP
jgi:MFS family permease